MAEKIEAIALINPVAGLPEAEQRRICAKFEISDFFIIGKDGDHEAFIKMLRAPRVALVAYAGLLAEQRGRKLDRADSMAATKAAIHKRGRWIVEAATGRTSLKGWATMRREGEDMCRRLSQGAKSALNARRGSTPLGDRYKDSDLRDMMRVRESKKYPNWRTRAAAIKKLGINPVPGRTWFLRHLEPVARSRGLLD